MTDRVERVRATAAELRPHLDVVILAIAAIVAVTPFGRLFASSQYLLLAAGAVLVATATAVLLRRRSLGLALLAHIGAMAVYLLFVVFRVGLPLPSDLADAVAGLTGSWDGLLSTSLPAPSVAELVVLPVVLAWGATLCSVEMALRTKWVAATVVPSVVVLTVALMFAGKRPTGLPLTPLLLAAAALLVVLLRNNAAVDGHRSIAVGIDGEPQGRGVPLFIRIGVPVVLLAALLGTAAAGALPVAADSERYELREQYQPPLDFSNAVTPLAEISGAINPTGESPVVFEAKFPEAPDDLPALIPVATLDQYDGAVWTTSAQFTKLGAELPEAPGAAPERTATIRQEYTLTRDYDLPFLPALVRPVSVKPQEGDEVLGFDRATGMVVAPDGTRRGFRYEVRSEVPRYTDDEKKSAGWSPDADLAELGLPPEGRTWPQGITGFAPADHTAPPYDYLTDLEATLRGTAFGYNTKSTPGHSLFTIDGLLRPRKQGDDQQPPVGQAEQFAAAFAVLARATSGAAGAGLPSRVVVGYKLNDIEAAKKGEAVKIRESDLHAWAEVHLAGVGWVTFDPTNTQPRDPDPPEDPQPQPETPTTSSTSVPDSTPIPEPVPEICNDASADCVSSTSGFPLWPFVLGSVVVLVPSGIVGAKHLRRRRRMTTGSPAQRVIGAWRETKDRLRSGGIPTNRSMTVRELAESAPVEPGSDTAARLMALAPVVDTALYAPDDPPDAMVEAAWDAEAGVADAVRQQSSLPRRVATALNPTPLFTRS